ncbi:DNA adenine methylase [Archangium violaceum]|uniref:XkdF-like putative serine protease domain-containing protein n=1 Tax=Archangium violaceum TaxID=83451 RepID=UPI00193C41EE|nr:XkdF-like putative serine protease domain-containing protein [Archangium violaceum]QRK08554.1 DNA adenine methylase [Archangium violaceum]
MRDRREAAIAYARRVLAAIRGETEVEKTIWGSPAGKKRLADRLVAMLPAHKTYVEPFAGSAAVLFAKEPSRVEVINDADPEIAEAFRLLKKLSPEQVERLRKMPWVGDEKTFKSLYDSEPKSDLERLYRFLYLSHFSYGRLRGRSFSPAGAGVEAQTVTRIERFAPRLKHVKVYSGDYERVVRKYDAKDTVFFLDPPYPGYNVDVGESKFDEERFLGVLKSLRGRFLMTYGIRGKLPGLLKEAGYFVKRIRTPRSIASMRGVGGSSVLTQLLVANYEPAQKGLDEDFELDDWSHGEQGASEASAQPFTKSTLLLKGLDPNDERYVLGIVLEPEVVDAQGDIYSTEEIRRAAHRFMEEFGGLGLMHRLRVNGQVKVLESYLAPTDFTVGEVQVRKGTWLLAVRVLSDELWERVKNGALTGFSIGGSARRVPEPAGPPSPTEQPQAEAA